MTINIPNLDVIHLKLVDKAGVVTMPLCEVISGVYHKEGQKHIITSSTDSEQVAELDALKMCRMIDDAFVGIEGVECWVIQEAGEIPSPLVKGFMEQFA